MKPYIQYLTMLIVCMAMLQSRQMHAQICNSNSLKPVFFRDFGAAASATTNSAAPAGSTNYNFGNVGTDGNYILTPRVENANKNDWTKGGDHTGNTNGNMFLVNAGGNNAIFFRDTAKDLCRGSIFNFSAWLANVNTPRTNNVCGSGLVYPRVTFRIRDINNNILGSVTTDTLPLSPNDGPLNWRQYGFQFTLPDSITTVIFEMVDLFGGRNQCGNDLALDDILFTACTPTVTANISANSTACIGTKDTITALLINSPYVNPAYQWQKSTNNGATWINIGIANNTNSYFFDNVSNSDNGMYRVLVGPNIASLTTQTCIAASNSVPFTVNPLPRIQITNNNPVCDSNTIRLQANINGGLAPYNFRWKGPNNFFSNQLLAIKNNAQFIDSGWYNFRVVDNNGCIDSVETKVSVAPNPLLAVQIKTDTICSNDTAIITAQSSIVNSKYNWQSSIVQGSISGNTQQTNGTNNVVKNVLVNNGNQLGIVRYVFFVITDSGCISKPDTVLVYVAPTPSIAIAMPDTLLCSDNSIELKASTPFVGIGKWTTSSNATINNVFANTTIANNLQPNTNYTFTYTITGADVCKSSTDTVVITNIAKATKANAGNDTLICNFENAINLTLKGNAPKANETGVWTIVHNNGASITAVNDSSIVANFTQAGTYTFVYTISNIFNCGNNADTVVITISNKPKANAIIASTQITCVNNSVLFTATNFTGQITKWQYKWGNGNWIDTAITTNEIGFKLQDSIAVRYIVAATNNDCTITDTSTATATKIYLPTVAGVLQKDTIVCISNNTGTLFLQNFIGNIVRWESSTDSSNWQAISYIGSSYTFNNLTATSWFRVLVKNGDCDSLLSNTIKVFVSPAVSKAVASKIAPLCFVDSVQLIANAPIIGNGVWQQIGGAASTIVQPNAASTTVKNLQAGNYAFTYTISNGVCANSVDTVAVTIYPFIQNKIDSSNYTICKGDSILINNQYTILGNVGIQWLVSTDGINFSIINNETAANIKVSPTSTSFYKRIITANGCSNESNIIKVIVDEKPSAAIAMNDTTICATTSTIVTATTPNVGIGKWIAISPNSLQINNENNASTSINNLQASNTIVWQVSNNNTCGVHSDTVHIIVVPSATKANAGNDTLICNFENSPIQFPLNGNATQVAETLKWQIIEQPIGALAIITNDTLRQTTIQISTAGKYIITYTISNAINCNNSTDTVVLNISNKPKANAIIASTQITCINNSVLFTATSFIGQIKKWQYKWGNGNWIDTAITATQIGVKLQDSIAVRYIVAATNNNCIITDTSAATATKIYLPTVAGVLQKDTIVCISNNTGILFLQNFIGNIVRWESSTDSSNWQAISYIGSSYTFNNLTSTSWFRVLVKNGDCDSMLSNTIKVFVSPAVSNAVATKIAPLCFVDSVQLIANAPIIGNGVWKQIGGAASTIVQPNAASTTVKNLQAGNYAFTFTISNGVCANSVDTVNITIRPLATKANAGNDTLICNFENPINFTLKGNAPKANETGVWTIVNNNGASTTAVNDSSIVANFTQAGTYTFVYTLSNTFNCGNNADTVVITISNKPKANAIIASTQITCINNSVLFTASSFTGQIKKWQYKWGNGNWIDTAITTNEIGFKLQDSIAVRYIVAATNNNCTISDTSTATATKIYLPTVAGVLQKDTIVCITNNTGTLFLQNFIGNIIRWESSTDSSNWQAIAHTASSYTFNNLTATGWFRVLVKNGDCDSLLSNTIKVFVSPAVSKAVATKIAPLCFVDSVQLIANAPIIGNGVWQQIGGAASTIVQPNAASTTVKNLQAGNYAFTYTISNGVCANSVDTVAVTIYPFIINAIDITSFTVCEGTTIIIKNNTAFAGNTAFTIEWWQQQQGDTSFSKIPNQSAANLTISVTKNTKFKRILYANNCYKESNIVFATIEQKIATNTITGNQAICINTQANTINGNNIIGATYQWQISTDSINFININNATDSIYTPTKSLQKTFYKRIAYTPICFANNASTSNIVAVSILPNAIATITTTSTKFCTPFTLSNNSIAAVAYNQNSKYNWYVNDSLIGSSIEFPTYAVSSNRDSLQIKLIAISAFNCLADSAFTNMYFTHRPKPNFTLDSSICEGEKIMTTNTTINAANYGFKWFINGILKSTKPTFTNLELPAASSGNDTIYTIALQAFNICDTVTITKTIVVKAKPHNNLQATLVNNCSPAFVQIQAAVKGNGIDSRLWFGNNTDTVFSNSSNTFTKLYNYQTSAYTATLISTNNCGTDTATSAIIIPKNKTTIQVQLQDSIVCGNTIQLQYQSTNAKKIIWNFGDGISTTTSKPNDTLKHSYTNFGKYTISALVNGICSDTLLYKNVYLYKAPVAAFTVNNPICIGDTVLLQNQSDSANYAWRFGDGNTSTQIQPIHVYNKQGVFTISLTATALYGTNSCSTTISKPVILVNTLKGKIAISDTLALCNNLTVEASNTLTGNFTTVWNMGNGTQLNGNKINYTYTQNGTYFISMKATNSGGCNYVDTVKVQQKKTIATLQIKAQKNCTKTPIQFSVKGENIDSVEWHFGDGNTLTTKALQTTYSYKNAGIYFIQAIVKNSSCNNTVLLTDTLSIDGITANITVAAQQECGKTIYTFTDSSISYNSKYTAKWMHNNFAFSGNTFSRVFTQNGDETIVLQVQNSNGCADTIRADFSVAVNQFPKASIDMVGNACRTALVNFQSKVESRDSIFLRLWDIGNGNTLNDTAIKVTYTTAGAFNVKLTVATVNKCFDSAFKALQVVDPPTVSINRPKYICRGNIAQLTANGAERFIWSNANNQPINFTQQISVAPTTTTTYHVIGFNEFGCSNIDSVTVNVVQPFALQVSRNDSICIGESITLKANGAATYTWLNNQTAFTQQPSVVLKPTQTTTYKVIAKDNFNCFTDSSQVTITVGLPTAFTIGKDTIINAGDTYQFSTTSNANNIIQYRWRGSNLSCNNCPTPQAKFVMDACVSCEVTNVFGCVSADTICIKTFCPKSEVFVPNAFSPDGDGINDKLLVQGRGISLVKSFRVYNRWGELVFQRNNFVPGDASAGWDGTVRGKAASPDVYVYVCEVLCEKGIPAVFKGNTAILK